MDNLDDRLTRFLDSGGPEFLVAIAPDGVLRRWIVHHLADETGESEEIVRAAVDRWLGDRQSDTVFDSDLEVVGLDDRIEILLEKRRQFNEAEEAVDIAYVDSEIGAALADVGRPMDALGRFMAAREAFQHHGYHLDAGVCDMEMAMGAKDLGWHDVSRRLYQRARPVIAQTGTVGDFARVLLNQANLENATGGTDAAFELQQRARWLAYEAQQIETYAVATHNLANSVSSRGDFEPAIELFLETRNIYAELDNWVAVADCDKNAGAAMIDNGLYDDGLELTRDALAAYLEYGQPVEAANARRTISHALDHLGDHNAAMVELERARATYAEMGRLPDMAACDVDLSYTLRSLGRFDEANEAVIRVQDAYREMGLDADDPWFDDTLAAIGRGEVDRHEHPLGETH